MEAAISAGLKRGTRRLDLAKRTEEAMGFAYGEGINPESALERVCAAARLTPLLPDEVRRRLEHEKKFTASADVDVVDRLYRSFFEGATRFATRLDFSGLQWGDEEALRLAEVLPSFAALESLDLAKNSVGARGGVVLAECLSGSAVLTSLGLGGNELDAEAGKALAKALEVNGVLKKCDLRYNSSMDMEAKAALRESVKGKEGFELLM